MNPKTAYKIYKALSDEKTRGRIITISIALFFFIFIPIAYFVENNPVALGIKAIKNIGGSVGDINVKSVKANFSEEQFFKNVSVGAMEGYKNSGVFASITLAQAKLESGTGSSGLTTRANNLFGIKAYNWAGKTTSMMTNEQVQGIVITISAPFRAYDNWEESIQDHTSFLTDNKRYAQYGVFTAKTYSEQAQALQNAGYATDVNYSRLLVTIIKQYNLDKYDIK
ncbi:glucosaminidase domain-containing protein [Clostridium algoriphilum]|uniref:glycoside hydrolase family 73 protein n=1 Tax=Clostridium algoriphilum TaxID=198347 RepID=UPI001CF3876B|nr:glucosaminidase domain-containing protein [Clostridium algoriphilum]MCB2295448.1 glucosaminidase domain-containing protein [Clostridium algoriphilum]